MSRFNNQDKPKAVWTHIEDVTDSDQKRSFYLSDGGAVKITRHTDRGEQLVVMMPASALEDLIKVAPAFEKVQQAFQSVAGDIAKTKEIRKEEAKLDRQKQQELNKAVLGLQALKDSEAALLARVQALTGKRIA